LNDPKGLKIRIPGHAGEVVERIGMQPISIPSSELYTALQRGTIDAVEWVGPDQPMTRKWVSKNYSILLHGLA
jgi:TRAP-type mannitol/chloroaromatic compound transport system substrate-binding protein